MQADSRFVQFDLFGSSYYIGSGKAEGEAIFTDTTFKMGAGKSFLTGTWALKDGTVTLKADDGSPLALARSKTTIIGNFPSSTAQLKNRVRVSLDPAGTGTSDTRFLNTNIEVIRDEVIEWRRE